MARAQDRHLDKHGKKQGHWVTTDDDQHIYIGAGGEVLPRGPGTKPRSKGGAQSAAGKHRTAEIVARARAGKGAAPAPAAAKAKAHDRLYNEGGEGFNPHRIAAQDAQRQADIAFKRSLDRRVEAGRARLERYVASARVQKNPEAVRRFTDPAGGMDEHAVVANRSAVARAFKQGNAGVAAKLREGLKARRAERKAR